MLVHSWVFPSFVNGPGKRFVLWTQGCKKGCKGCFNPSTWSSVGNEISVDDLLKEIIDSDCDGLTLTGGDPLEQSDEILNLLKKVNKLDLTNGVILYTGYTLDEIKSLSYPVFECLKYVDLLIDGRYEESYYLNDGLKGSSNQNYHFFSNKIKKEDLKIDHEIEIGLSENLYVTGFPHIDKKILQQFGIVFK